MALKQAQFNMIEQQIRPWDVLDQKVLDLLGRIAREDFVPEAYRNLAYADISIPIGHDQFMMPPKVEARMLQALDLHHTDRVLEIGTGSAYVTALLAMLACQVDSVDIFEDFQKSADVRMRAHKLDNVTLAVGDASQGWSGHGLYDVIAITGSLPELPDVFQQSLNRGGRLFAVVGEAPVMEAVLVRRVGEKEFSREPLFETVLPALKHALAPARFVF